MEEYTSGVIAAIRRSISAGALLLTLLMIGCGSGHNWNGTWVGNRNLQPKEGEDFTVVNTLSKVKITINGGKFEMTDAGMPKRGTVRYDGNKAYLKVTEMFGRPVEQMGEATVNNNAELILTAGPNGSATYEDPLGFETKPVELLRESQPGS